MSRGLLYSPGKPAQGLGTGMKTANVHTGAQAMEALGNRAQAAGGTEDVWEHPKGRGSSEKEKGPQACL